MALFTYRVFAAGTTFAGFNIQGRIYDRVPGVAYTKEPVSALTTAAEANQREFFTMEKFGIVVSEQDIPHAEFLIWRWTPASHTFQRIPQKDIDDLATFATKAKAMWAARRAWIADARLIILTAKWDDLTAQHRKILLGATIRDFTETDWDAVGLGDVGFVGDLNLSVSAWDVVREFFT